MKAQGTWVPLWVGGLAAAVFGGALVAYVWLPPTHGSYLGTVILFGLLAIACLGASRIEDHDDTLAIKERELTAKLDAVLERREKLRRVNP